MKIALHLVIILSAFSCYGQSYNHIEESSSNPFLSDMNGRPLYLNSSYKADGSPYFSDDYYMAQLTTSNGAIYKNVRVKINLLDHIIQYLTADGKEMITDELVRKIMISNFYTPEGVITNVLLEGFPTALNTKDAAVFMVLDTGKIKLLKKIIVTARDEKKYNDASTTRIFERREIYFYLAANGQIARLEKGKKAMLDLFAENRAGVASFIEQHKLSCKTEADYKSIFGFFNNRSGL